MTCMYYIQYQEPKHVRWYKKTLDKLNFNFRIVNVDSNKKAILINKKYINKKAYKKIQKYLIKNNKNPLSNNVLIAKEICVRYESKNIYKLQNELLMKNMLFKIIDYIEKTTSISFEEEFVYVLMNKDKDKNLLFILEKYFKGINIVTTSIGKIRRMEKMLSNEDITLAITNNRTKALKRAKIIINVSFDKDNINEFTINRNCIIINLNNCEFDFNNSFQGSIVNSIEIDFINKYDSIIKKNQYDKATLYCSYMHFMDKRDIYKNIEEDRCKIKYLIGKRGVITAEELRNNLANNTIKLDKMGKKD